MAIQFRVIGKPSNFHDRWSERILYASTPKKREQAKEQACSRCNDCEKCSHHAPNCSVQIAYEQSYINLTREGASSWIAWCKERYNRSDELHKKSTLDFSCKLCHERGWDEFCFPCSSCPINKLKKEVK